MDTTLTKEVAKATAQAGELEVAAMIPADLVASIQQHPTGTLFRCEGERDYSWYGGTTVVLQSVDDLAPAITALVATDAGDGWVVQRQADDPDGTPAVLVADQNGYSYAVGGLPKSVSVLISSASPCFRLADGDYPTSY